MILNREAAIAYGRKHGLHALLISRSGSIVCEIYAAGYAAERPHALYSGTKSFWGIAALEAVRDGLFALDDSIANVIDAFRQNERAAITPRMLLQMTAGYGFGGLGSAVPTYAKAIAMPLKSEPGARFVYSGIPLQVFGAFFAGVLKETALSPREYLDAKVLRPAGVAIGDWRTLSDGTNPLSTGAQITASNWLSYGRWIMEHRRRYAEAFEGSSENPRYGLCWWLQARGAPPDLFYASGSGGQALYVVPSLELAIVHFGASAGYQHEAFLRNLFS